MRVAMFGLFTCIAIATAAGQTPAKPADPLGSRYLSMENAGYEAITQLRNRGFLTALDPLAQPYHRVDIARALVDLDPDTLARPVATWVRLLRKEMAPELARLAGRDSIQLGIEVLGGAAASSSRSLTPILPYYDSTQPAVLANRVWPNYSVGFWAETGRFALETRLHDDFYISPFRTSGEQDGDPYGTDPGGIAVFKQNDDAYLSATYSLGTFFVGRMARNWAPLGDTGLMISDNPTTYPQIGFDIGGHGFALRFMAGELDTAGGEYSGQARFITGNEIEYRTDEFAISVGEAKLVVSQSGLPFTDLSPLELTFFEVDNVPEESTGNTVLSGQLWVHHSRTTLYGEALLDDIGLNQRSPLRGAVSGGLQYQPAAPWLNVGADMRVVTAFCYWTLHGTDQWSTYGRGLGDNFSDYARLSLHASIYPDVAGLRLTPTLELQAKGEGDFRMPVIPEAQFLTMPSLFLGVKETTRRVALAGRYDPTPHFFVDWDGGINFITNANHQAGRGLTQFAGVARLGVTWSAPGVGSP